MSGPPPVTFGDDLRDAFKPVNSWVSHGIAWLEDIQSFYRERAALEKEYATKLAGLARRFHDKKSKKSAVLTVGDTPQLTPGSLESASLTTWTTILTTTESLAAEHDAFANALMTQVADVLKALGGRYDDYRKRHEALAGKLLAERDGVWADLKKAKVNYDAECKGVEEKRQKVDKSYDSSKTKAQRSYETELVEMSNVKNTYLLQIAAANRLKHRYFYEDLPDVINSLQDLNETRVTKVNSIWTLSANLETTCRQNTISHLNTQITEIARNLPVLDSGMFLKHNIPPWVEPSDFVFEPSPVWHDNPNMVVEEPAQVYLRNILQKRRKLIPALEDEVQKRVKEIGQLSQSWEATKLDESQAQKETDAARGLIYCKEEILPHSTKLLVYQTEIEIIIDAVGDVARGTQSHNFKSTTFKIPTNCDFCSERIWGLTSKGFTCSDCGYSCHSKCEMKVPAACPGVLDKAAKKALRTEKKSAAKAANGSGSSDTESSPALTRTSTVTSTTSTLAPRGVTQLSKSPSIASNSSAASSPAKAPARRVLAPPPDRYVAPTPTPATPSPPSTPTGEAGKMIYTFTPSGDNELAASEGASVSILADDGAWMTVRLASGEEGLVPSSYVEKVVKKSRGPPPPVKPRGGAKKEKEVKVKALYEYHAAGEDELDMEEGEEFVVLERDVAGWVRVRRGAERGLVPGTYVVDV